jgi:stage II sporulation protein R
MGGVFMIKFVKICVGILVVLVLVSLFADRRELRESVIRLHVVADSDEEGDQAVKLKVRDAVLGVMEDVLAAVKDKKRAEAALQNALPAIKEAADRVLDAEGIIERAFISLSEEAFPIRHYDTFSLPAGVYDSLRVTIGSGQGKNWWCVVFPGLCVPAASEEVKDVAASSGFSESLSGSITGQCGYQVRFWVLDWLGRVENFFHKA